MADLRDLAESMRKSIPDIAQPGSLFAKFPEFRMPPIPPNPLVVATEANYASAFHKHLVKWINEFDSGLDPAHEVGVRLVSFGQIVIFHLRDIGYQNPSLILFSGVTDNDEPVELIQHVSQISILLMRLPRKDPSKPKKSIGFAAVEDGANLDEE